MLVFSALCHGVHHNDTLLQHEYAPWYSNWWRNLHGCTLLRDPLNHVQWILRTCHDHNEASCFLQTKRSSLFPCIGICLAIVDSEDTHLIYGSWSLGVHNILCHRIWSQCWKVRNHSDFSTAAISCRVKLLSSLQFLIQWDNTMIFSHALQAIQAISAPPLRPANGICFISVHCSAR